MSRHWILVSFLIVVCIGISTRAAAWSILMHLAIARRAFDELPEQMKRPLHEYLDVITWASVVPDVVLKDWENHDWNLHEGARGNALKKIEELTCSLEAQLAVESPDWAVVAYQMGLLAHYLADLNEPLHTDESAEEETLVHYLYEHDAWVHMDELPVQRRGHGFRVDPIASAKADARRANRHYHPVLMAYLGLRGFDDARGLTCFNFQRAVEAVSDAWRTAWGRAVSRGPSVALRMNRTRLEHGDTLRLWVSVLPGKDTLATADLYLGLHDKDGGLWFLDPRGNLRPEAIPAAGCRPVSEFWQVKWLSVLLTPDVPPGEYAWIAVLVRPGADPMDLRTWVSEPEVVPFTVVPVREVHLNELGNEVMLFSARRPQDAAISWLPLRRWDFVFLGEQKDDLLTSEDESATDSLIPGVFNHMLVYIGRDQEGTAYGVEMTADLSFEGPFLRIVKLREFEQPAAGSEGVRLTVVNKDVERYAARWALRLAPKHLEKLDFTGPRVLRRVEKDIHGSFPYQLEYRWSGDLNDKRIFLVDDGRSGGSSCTDYWLATLETYGRVCVHGSRISASDLEEYFRYDPEGVKAMVPRALNPFPFDLSVQDVLDMGFYAIDPAPHRFLCDGSEETGLPIPDRLMERSPDLVPIEPVVAE